MGRRLLLTVVAALLLAAPAAAQPRELWPGVTFERAVQFTSNGPVAINVMIGPRPGGTTTLAPALSNETLTGRETLTSIQRRLAGSATTAGVNGDFFDFDTGVPSGVLLREGQVLSRPFGQRSSAGIMTDGTLDIRRVAFFGTWQGAGAKRTLNAFNETPPANGTSLYTQAWGQTTPALPGATALVLFPLPAPVPNADLAAPVVEVRTEGGPVPIPLGGAVLVGVGAAAAALAAEGLVGQAITSRLIFRPEWPGVVSAIGGGPQIVRNGGAIFRASEAFTPVQLGARAGRTGLGQLADGRIILVAVDAGQPGYSVGLTNFELAQTMVRLGAVTAMAFDGGGSTTMAHDGTLLSKPAGQERPIATALQFEYTGVFVQPALAVVSPDGDGVSDRQSLRFKLVRPSTTTVTLTAPDGVVAFTEQRDRQPGGYRVPFPPVAAPPVALSSSATPPTNGRWKLQVAAVDDVGQPSEMTQTFTVNTTVGFLSTAPRKLFLPPRGRDLGITWKQSRPARVVVTVETPSGEIVRTLARRVYPVGAPALVWNGLDRTKNAVRGGGYVIRVTAKNALGTVELSKPVRVQRIVGPR